MTRRVRFTPRDRLRSGVAGLSLVGLLAAAGSAAASEVPFGPAAVVGSPSLPMRTAPGDLDRDGDLDFASAGRFGIAWHENVGGTGSSWTSHTVSTATIFTSIAQGDLDRDGDVDLVATLVNLAFDRIFWYENTAGNGSAWTLHTIETGIDGPRHAVLADVDGDGDPDVVSNAVNTAQAIYWHENVAGNGTSWVRHTIATGVENARNVSAVDVDRDGDLDVVAASQFVERKVAWYENLDGQGGSWAIRTIATPSGAGLGHAAADVDGDGDVDVVTTPTAPGPLYWFENTDGHGAAWARRTIATLPSGVEVRDVTAADVDGDGDVDVMAPLGSPVAMGRAVWYENADGAGTAWIERTIGTIGPLAYQVVAADVDGDGDQDAASVSFYGNEVVWYRNQSIHRTAFFIQQPDIVVGPATSTSGIHLTPADLDGDGDLDVVSGLLGDVEFSWQENVGGAGSAWVRHVILTTSGRIDGAPAADLDGDGDLDVATAPQSALTAFHNGGGGASWTPTPIAPIPLFQIRKGPRIVDVDGDGDTDVVAADGAGYLANRLMWFENAGDGVTWTPRTVASAVVFGLGRTPDVDGDGDPDLLAILNSGTVWYESVGGGASWNVHTLTASFYSLLPGNPDGDGDLDFFVSSGTGLYWMENAGGGASWTLRTVDAGESFFSWTDAADLDGDGDQDGVAGPFWFENTDGDGGVWTRRSFLSTTPALKTAITADLDGDGDPDLLTARTSGEPADTVGWLRNESGQVRFDVADQVPPGVGNGDVFSTLRLTATHGGRAGDSDLELASLGLRFLGDDALTTAQANALIEELRVYRDANGNGTFDPGTDTLVATVPTLALTNGVQTVPFTDGDPNVRVAQGASAAFFVVVQLTANASEQAPNQFRVVHLATGASPTHAEDASADVGLSTAGPADFTSGLVGPVTPVELTGFTVE
jgi:VCBS repeat protein